MNEEYLTSEEVNQVEELEKLANALQEGESPEEKRIKSLVSATTDEGLKATLQERLDEIQSETSVDVEDVIDRLENMGISHASALRHGITKIRQQIKWRAKNRENRDSSDNY